MILLVALLCAPLLIACNDHTELEYNKNEELPLLETVQAPVAPSDQAKEALAQILPSNNGEDSDLTKQHLSGFIEEISARPDYYQQLIQKHREGVVDINETFMLYMYGIYLAQQSHHEALTILKPIANLPINSKLLPKQCILEAAQTVGKMLERLAIEQHDSSDNIDSISITFNDSLREEARKFLEKGHEAASSSSTQSRSAEPQGFLAWYHDFLVRLQNESIPENGIVEAFPNMPDYVKQALLNFNEHFRSVEGWIQKYFGL